MEKSSNKLNMELEENKSAMLNKYKDIDVEQRVIQLNIVQAAYLNKLMSGGAFKFQTEDDAKKKLSKMVRDMTKQNTVKSKNNDTYSSASDVHSVKKTNNKPKNQQVQPKPVLTISEGMKK
jgi:hypothetical protein